LESLLSLQEHLSLTVYPVNTHTGMIVYPQDGSFNGCLSVEG
jgi:hypothetical protein